MQVDSSLFDRPEVELDKNKFELHVLPTDTYEAYSNDRNSVDKIWDGILNTESPTFLTGPGTPMPQWFTFDLGVTAPLPQMKLYQRGTNANCSSYGGIVKTFELWGRSAERRTGKECVSKCI